tara:strand:+ start:4606 stop:6033 length:1428 start_codon:yes stop_codon:yes gene_type:complete
MEQMTQELNMDNHNLKSIKKLYNDSMNSNVFLNTYTMIDVEDGKKHLFSYLMKKYNYKNSEYIQDFVDNSAIMLAKQIFSSSSFQSQSHPCVSTEVAVTTKADLPVYRENHRIINIDSCYRENLLSQNKKYNSYTSSDMIIDLNDTLDSTVSIELANICIPFTFYNISEDQGNNYFYVYDISNNSPPTKIAIDPGNYSNSSIISSINDKLSASSIDLSFAIQDLTNTVTVTSGDASGYTAIFYDNNQTSEYSFADRCLDANSGSNVQSKVNHNLGWLLGFRNVDVENYDKISYDVNSTATVTAEALCHLPYTKYFIIVIDDMNKNQSNKSLVQINNGKSYISNKKYFKDIDNSLNCLNDSNYDSYVNASGRTLTKNQLYSSLQVNNYRASFNETNSKLSADLINNVFAIVPFETKSLVWGSSMFTSDKNRFKRKYNGPVDISKLNVKLLDDRGNLLNLNGADWSLSMISTHSYKK